MLNTVKDLTRVLLLFYYSWVIRGLMYLPQKTAGYEEMKNNNPTAGLSEKDKKKVEAETEDLEDEYKEDFVKLFCAAGLLHKCDRVRYQPVIDHFVSAYAVEHVDYAQRDLFPRDVETAVDTTTILLIQSPSQDSSSPRIPLFQCADSNS